MKYNILWKIASFLLFVHPLAARVVYKTRWPNGLSRDWIQKQSTCGYELRVDFIVQRMCVEYSMGMVFCIIVGKVMDGA